MSHSKLIALITFAAMTVQVDAVLAAPVTYSFSTGSSPFGANQQLINSLGNTPTVSGTFAYNVDAPTTGNGASTGYGYSIINYTNSSFPPITGFSGIVGGHTFSDPKVGVSVGNNMTDYPGAPIGTDYIMISADRNPAYGQNYRDPNIPYSLSGFQAVGYSLVNVRLYWATGINGASDFITSSALPSIETHK